MYADIYLAIVKNSLCVLTFYLSRDTLVKTMVSISHNPLSHANVHFRKKAQQHPAQRCLVQTRSLLLSSLLSTLGKKLIAGVVKIHD